MVYSGNWNLYYYQGNLSINKYAMGSYNIIEPQKSQKFHNT